MSAVRSLRSKVDWLVKRYGSYRAAAKIIGIDHGYLHKIGRGEKRPSREVLDKLGLIEVVSYRSNK